MQSCFEWLLSGKGNGHFFVAGMQHRYSNSPGFFRKNHKVYFYFVFNITGSVLMVSPDWVVPSIQY
jgi:hypothetical protein